MRTSGILLAALLAFGVLAATQTTTAQAATGNVYFTATNTPAAGGICPVENHYGTTLIAPTGTTEGKAYLDAPNPGFSFCSIYFEFTMTGDSTLDSVVHVNVYIGCDVPAAAGGLTTTLRWQLYLNGAALGARVDTFDQIVCTPGSLTASGVDLDPADTTPLVAGDLVSVGLSGFFETASPPNGSPPAPEGTVYVSTGTAAAASAMTNPAFIVEAINKVGTEAVGLSSAKSAASAPAGNPAFYNLTVKNLGTATKYTMSTTGLPTGYTAAFNPLSADLAANSTATTVLKVTIPASATGGTHVPFKVKVTSTAGANKTIDLAVDVLKTPGGPGTTGPGGTSGPGGTGPGGETTDEGFTGEGETGTAKKSPGIEFALNVLAVGMLVVAMRRRVA
ncbi:MAG: hypothetical protein V4510_05115 [bacterium]